MIKVLNLHHVVTNYSAFHEITFPLTILPPSPPAPQSPINPSLRHPFFYNPLPLPSLHPTPELHLPHLLPNPFANHSSSATSPSLLRLFHSHTRYLSSSTAPSFLSIPSFHHRYPFLTQPHLASSPSLPSPPATSRLPASVTSEQNPSKSGLRDDAEIESPPGVRRPPPPRINHTNTANNCVNHRNIRLT